MDKLKRKVETLSRTLYIIVMSPIILTFLILGIVYDEDDEDEDDSSFSETVVLGDDV